jgi:hypothetical protein
VVSVEEGAGQRPCPDLAVLVGVVDGTKITDEVRSAPGVHGVDQMLVAGVPVAQRWTPA